MAGFNSRLLYRDDRNKDAFSKRLKSEGRWGEFVSERGKLVTAVGCKPADLDYLLIKKYGLNTFGTAAATMVLDAPKKEDLPPRDTGKVGGKKGTKAKIDKPITAKAGGNISPEDAYRDKLPNGCPLWDPKIFRKSQTKFYSDVMWTEQNLARNDLNTENLHDHCPSLSCARYFWTTRYTQNGFTKHQETIALFTTRDKNALSDESRRRDSGKPLEALDSFTRNLADRYGIEPKSGGGEAA